MSENSSNNATSSNGETREAVVVETGESLVSGAVYMVGTSFILGVLFTVLVLLLLDFMRRNNEENK